MKARFGLPSASGSTNVPCGNTRGYTGARRAEARCARLRRLPRWGHVAWERRQPRRGCAADPRTSHAGARARRPQAAPCASRPHAHRGPDHATPGARRAAPRRCAQDGAAPGNLRTTPGAGPRRGRQAAASSAGLGRAGPRSARGGGGAPHHGRVATGEVGATGHERGEREEEGGGEGFTFGG
jgi:hypothetical protein